MRRLALILTSCCVLCLLFTTVGQSCKDLVAIGDATAGDYNLLLKVRDPSRPGPQVLVSIPQGYEYTFHTPWIGRPLTFIVHHAFIGVTSANDTPPHIIKAGMALTDAGLAYGDADTGSGWTNPSSSAWDDFDWLRYAYQTANTTTDALTLLTTATTRLHATSVSENLFVIGPTDATLLEADAYHTHTTPITDLCAKTNYPTALWQTQPLKTAAIASAFNTIIDTWAHAGQTIHLGSWCGLRLTHITTDTITVQPVPFPYFLLTYGIRTPTTVALQHNATIAGYRLSLLNLTTSHAHLRITTAAYAWETTLLSLMRQRYGSITTEDLMNWSRLHATDLDGQRPLCEDRYPDEGALICKIPTTNTTPPSAWFAANHACASIYVPVHITDTRIDPSYTTPAAATLSHHLLTTYGHGTLSTTFHRTERVFLQDTTRLEAIATHLPEANATLLLTAQDTGAQHQAIQTEDLWSILTNYTHDANYTTLQDALTHLWDTNDSTSLQHMNTTVTILHDYQPITRQIGDLVITIVNTTLQTTTYQGIPIPPPVYDLYQQAVDDISHDRITDGVAILLHVYEMLQDLP